jgi:hypothetical protein
MHNWKRCSKCFSRPGYLKRYQAEKISRFNPTSFLLWDLLKGKINTKNPCTIDDLEVNIRQKTAAIPEDMLQREKTNLEHRVKLRMDVGGDHFQHLMTGCNFKRTEVCTYNIWSPSVNKMVSLLKSGASSRYLYGTQAAFGPSAMEAMIEIRFHCTFEIWNQLPHLLEYAGNTTAFVVATRWSTLPAVKT